MDVRQLKLLLDTIDPNLEVGLSKDAEGNSFSPLHEPTVENMLKTSGYELEPADRNEAGSKDYLILWPVN